MLVMREKISLGRPHTEHTESTETTEYKKFDFSLCPPCPPCLREMYLIIIVLSMFLAAACSTQPKNPGVTYSLRRQAETQLNQGNKQADRGELGTALAQLEEAMRLAIATDDPGLRVRAGLSRGNVLFSLGRREEAEEAWNNALDEAESIGGSELIAVSRIHIARGKLLASTGGSPAGVAESVRDEVNRDMALVRSDQFYTAFAWMVIGLAEKELGRYAQAEAALRRSLDIHEKDRNFELAAYDWFMIASFRSLAGDYRGARQALETAISFDRSVENSWGLASDWRALGDVNRKAGDRDAAHAAYLRAAQIFRAMGNGEAAEETLSRSENR